MSTQAYFTGDYVEIIRDSVIAAAVSGENCILMGGPGEGKTTVGLATAKACAGDNGQLNHTLFVNIHATTPEHKVVGDVDYEQLLSTGKFTDKVDGSAYDPNVRIGFFDEVTRATGALMDALLGVLAMENLNSPANPRSEQLTCIGTANFALTGKEHDAFLDRFTLWPWIDPDPATNDEVLEMTRNHNSGQKLTVPGLPTFQQIEKVKGWVCDDESNKAVAKVINQLCEEASKNGLYVNRRRITKWVKLLTKVSQYYYDSPNFTKVHPKAIDILKYAWVCPTKEEAQKWADIAGQVVDPFGVVLSQVKIQALEAFSKAADQIAKADPSKRGNALGELGEVLAEAQEKIEQVSQYADEDNKNRATETELLLQRWFQAAVSGKDPRAVRVE